MQRMMIAGFTAVLAITVAADGASAQRYRDRDGYRDGYRGSYRYDNAQSRSADRIRANNLDPTRELKYPDWARRALAPKGGGGGGGGRN